MWFNFTGQDISNWICNGSCEARKRNSWFEVQRLCSFSGLKGNVLDLWNILRSCTIPGIRETLYVIFCHSKKTIDSLFLGVANTMELVTFGFERLRNEFLAYHEYIYLRLTFFNICFIIAFVFWVIFISEKNNFSWWSRCCKHCRTNFRWETTKVGSF